MNDEIEEEIEQEIVRRALKRSYFRKREKEKRLYAEDVLDVLEEMTDLPRYELLKIAQEVQTAYSGAGEGLFSIRYQIILVGLPIITLLGVPILAVCSL